MTKVALKKHFLQSEQLPWQQAIWQRFFHFLQQHPHSLLPHALYFSGISGVGKRHFARQFIQAFFCQKRQTKQLACGHCRSCLWMRDDVHPSLLWIQPETAHEQIKIEQIREAMDFIQETGLHDTARFVVIEPVDHLNHSAANALLKSLEEPPEGVYFILIHDQVGALVPATIVSRCQRIIFPPVSVQESSAWLSRNGLNSTELQAVYMRLSQGAPLRVIEQFEMYNQTRMELLRGMIEIAHQQRHPIIVSQGWVALKIDIETVLEWLMHIVIDVVRGYYSPTQLINQDHAKLLLNCASKTTPSYLLKYVDYLTQVRRYVLQGVHLNVQLVFDVLLLQWQRVMLQQELLGLGQDNF